MRVLITRPRADAEALASDLRTRGVQPIIAPLLEIIHVPGPPTELEGTQAILATSANGVRAFASRDARRNLPLYAVGPATAQAARDVGFRCIATAGGDVAHLAELVRRTLNPARGAVLHVAGTALAGDLAGELGRAGFTYRRVTLYQSRRVEQLPAEASRALAAGAVHGVVFYSPRTAGVFVDLVRKGGLAERSVDLVAFCLSDAVADRCRELSWRSLVVAMQPDGEALLEAITGQSVGEVGANAT